MMNGAPPKPWESMRPPPCCEQRNTNNRAVSMDDMRAMANPAAQFQSTLGGDGSGVGGGGAPPLPPRPAGYWGSSAYPYSNTYGGYGYPYSGGYSSGSASGMGGGVGGYSSVPPRPVGYTRPMVPYGPLGPGPESWFIQAAEEGSRDAFQSIESFVSVFTSISQMLESTYVLIHSSFRAVVGVAEQMGRMRLHLAEVLSAVSVMRTIRYVVNFLRRWLGYPELVDSAELAWREAGGSAAAPRRSPSPPRPSRWPFLAYLIAVLGAPYIIYRTMRAATTVDPDGWKRGRGEHFAAVAGFDFSAGGPSELSVRAGQELRLAPRILQPRLSGWVLASDGTNTGLVPTAYVKIKGLVPGDQPPLAPQPAGFSSSGGQQMSGGARGAGVPASQLPPAVGSVSNISPTIQQVSGGASGGKCCPSANKQSSSPSEGGDTSSTANVSLAMSTVTSAGSSRDSASSQQTGLARSCSSSGDQQMSLSVPVENSASTSSNSAEENTKPTVSCCRGGAKQKKSVTFNIDGEISAPDVSS